MSVNVYLKGEEVTKLDGFKTVKQHHQGNSWDNYNYKGLTLYCSGGDWYFTLYNVDDNIPDALKELVERVVYMGRFSFLPAREAGEYLHESAVAKVSSIDNSGKGNRENSIRIDAVKMEDLRELLKQIRVGSIRPHKSYEGPQNGLSRNKLEAELKEANAKLELSWVEIDHLKELLTEKATERIDDARKLAMVGNFKFTMAHTIWPLCFRTRVVRALSDILGSSSAE